MKAKHSSKRVQALTLLELMIAMSILTIFLTSVISASLLSRRISEGNIYENTAMTVAQGYMEQIKSIEYDIIVAASESGGQIPLPTKSVSALLTGSQIEIEDPLYVGDYNEKEVMIDLRTDDYESESGDKKVITMDFKIKPVITDLDNGSKPIRALQIVLYYQYFSPAKPGGEWRTGSVRFLKSYAPTF